MSKELPYFQFEPAEYLTKDVAFCSLQAQGLFTLICSYYWQRNCELSQDQVLRRLNYPDEFQELINENVIKIKDGKISIKFLDLQRKRALDICRINSENGAKGGRPRKQIKTETKPTALNSLSETKGIRRDKKKRDNIKEDNKKGEITPLSHFGIKNYEILDQIDDEWKQRMNVRFTIDNYQSEFEKFCSYLFDLGEVSKTVKDFKSHYVNLKNKRPDFLSNGTGNKIDWEKV